MANDINEWEIPTYSAWRQAAIHRHNLRLAQKKLGEAFDALETAGVACNGTRRTALALADRAVAITTEEEKRAYDAHVEAFLEGAREETEPCHGVPV